MDRPVVALENADAVYDYYLAHQQNRRVARLAYGTLARRFRPRVHYGIGARERLRSLIYDDRRLIVAVNHVSDTDPYTVAAAAWSSALRPVIGRTRVLAKDELFGETEPGRGRALAERTSQRRRGIDISQRRRGIDISQRRRIDMMGGIPVFRGKDHGLRAAARAGNLMMDVCAERLRRGDDLALFPEGTCNEGCPAVLQHVGSGIGHIVVRARAKGIEPTLVVMGLHYGPPPGRFRSASVHIDVPDLTLPEKPITIARTVAEYLQVAVELAVSEY
ncbi:lysophospholipid acyltransferase family protein [Rhodococcoides corynebacterioides]|uniref:1-acyl-sn-glycerol-3-phosphate acyltransferase n=1 Tax=Rhodococcoides corynebacterioides TaxID=53972 RepID=A0ABS7P5L8_9NOCA|nr:1-acyl-sn-glycerol-3-phosphate acyltransferase [Rhodococcus corynebacterioides]MBY6367729.1 1-acyl-sn-glycerol-3-phosphate acyltransferase [Rhodococcus corynebacterioides]MBY6408512.1 1-acyl-sn-glycerol-3-phosphate acyltransferase [Rhodococcus corynebacterioides]